MSDKPMTMERWQGNKRLGGLWRFAIAISVLNVLGHTLFGFEPAWAHVFVALGTAYAMELAIEAIDARMNGRAPAFAGSLKSFVQFLLPAHITGLAVGMLLYSNERFWVLAFAVAVAIASKAVLRLAVIHPTSGARARRHFLNPSNFGIAVTLVAFPSVGIAPPYQFTENLHGPIDYLLPLLIVATGTLINMKFTDRLPLILTWAGAFVVQALLRSWWFDLPWQAALAPMSGFAFVLFTFYMITDPASTPSRVSSQVMFGGAVALCYGLLMTVHVAFGLFFALAIVSAVRGAAIYFAGVTARARVPESLELRARETAALPARSAGS